MSSQNHIHLELVDVTVFGNRIFANVIKLRRGHTESG